MQLHLDGPYGDTGFAGRLGALADQLGAPDSYGEGELVRRCEEALARALGKERALLFATGTLANLLALGRHCGRHHKRVLVHPESHLVNDTGDSLAAVGGLTAIIAEPDGAGFAAASIDAAVTRASSGRVAQGLGAVCIETPVRRLRNAAFPAAALDEVLAAARRHGLAAHLDGARLPIAAAAAGRSMASFAAPFDTVYLSLWKMLGLPFGAVLAGSAAVIDGMEHERRAHGGALAQFWPLAAVVLDELPALEPGWTQAFARLDQVKAALAAEQSLEVVPVGTERTNTFWLAPRQVDAATYRQRCRERGILLGDVEDGRVLVRANPSWCQHPAGAIIEGLLAAS